MSLQPGVRLGPYEVVSLLGSGGMGEVYRARDTKLNRDVAIKVLPEVVATDPERLARFHREAQVLASLNHPNIAAIYGFEDSNNTHGLVMELVEGPTLADRIASGPIPLNEALPIARQIAEALEAAHEQGIIHRDLKPANIKVRDDGTVKVLDFGLAKLVDPVVRSNPNVTASPTITTPAMMTGVGVILGTAAYMSPEQAKGRVADKRSDIWAFGVVLYEMLTGQRLFGSEDVAETLAAVITREPDWSRVPATARLLLQRCLARDPKRRLRDIGDAWMLLDSVGEGAAGPTHVAVASRRLPWALAASAVLGLTVIAFVHVREVAPAERTLRLSVSIPQNSPVASFALSPDGRRLAIALLGAGRRQLWLRDLDAQQPELLAGTDDAQYPFWSPDSRSIGFFAEGKLKTIPATGGPAQSLCDASAGGGGAWNRQGAILFAADVGPLRQVPATGGTCTAVTKTDGGINHQFPEFLPDGNHFFYLVDGGEEAKRGVYLAALDNPTGGHRILADQSSVVFVPPSSGTIGHVLFLRDTTLMAQPFDVGTLQSIGDVFPVTGQATFSVTATLRQVAASASGNGVLVYLANRVRDSQLTWFDRSGKALEQVIPSGGQRTVVLSPDGKTAAIGGPQGLSLRDLIRGVDTRFTFPPLIGTAAVWSPDGARLVFSSANTLYVKDASGSGQEDPVFQNANIKLASDWSPDGRFLLYTEIDPKTRADLWILADPLNTTGDHKPVKFLATEFNESMGQFSPDGRWIAYVSDESGQPEVYVRPFPSRSGKWRVSRNRGIQPRWRRDGKELFYMESGRPGHRWMAVPVRPASEGRFEAGEPTMLFAFTTTFTTSLQRNDFVYSPSADGGRFLVNTAVVDASNALLNVITNWEKAAASAAKEP